MALDRCSGAVLRLAVNKAPSIPTPQTTAPEEKLFFQVLRLVCVGLPVGSKSFIGRCPFSFWKNHTNLEARVESECGSLVVWSPWDSKFCLGLVGFLMAVLLLVHTSQEDWPR